MNQPQKISLALVASLLAVFLVLVVAHARGWPMMLIPLVSTPTRSSSSPPSSSSSPSSSMTSTTSPQNVSPAPPTTNAITTPDNTNTINDNIDSAPLAPADSTPPAIPTPLPGGAMLSINFDDGFASAFKNGLPIIDEAGLKSTWYIITGKLGQKNYMSEANVLQLAREGHEVGAHTRTHPHLTTLSSAAMSEEIDGSRDDLIAMGIHPQTFAYPYGDFNAQVANTVKSAGFVGARITRPGLDGANAPTFALLSHGVVADTTFAQVAGWIDDARAKRLWLILTFHRVDENGNSISVPHTLLYQIVHYIVAKKIRVVTTAEGLHRILGT